MEDAANLDVRINTEMNGDVACSTRFQNTTETIPSPLTPGIEPSSSNSEATITLCKEIEHENSCNKPKHNVTCGHGAAEQASDARDANDSRRKFRVLGLTFPGKWMNSEKFLELLDKSESFHMWFDKNAKGGVKQGGLSAVYGTHEEAKQAFASIHKMTFDGIPLKLQASKLFYDPIPVLRTSQPPIPFKTNSSDQDAPRRLYALHLTSATDQTLLSSIFGSECIEAVQLEPDPFIPSEKQAEIVFHTVDEANDARVELADGFEIDEGDRQLTMRLLTTDEYISYMKSEYDKIINARVVPVSASTSVVSSTSLLSSPSASSTTTAAASETAVVPFVPAPEITVEDVTGFVQQYVDDTRTNWAELNELSELWKLCDDVSQLHKGIPDSLLKIALLNVLERHQRTLPSHWMRQHLDDLIRIWKKETQNTKCSRRSTSYTMCAAPYVPYNDERKNLALSTEKKRALATIMGVGEVLAKVRTMLATEEGELEVDEDEHGNYTIDGKPLSFESWASFNKPVEPVPFYGQPSLFIDPKLRKLRNQRKKEARQKKMEEEKIKKMRGVNTEIENEKDESVDLEASGTETETPETRKELEEGEMSSESSSSASTSSDEDNDNEATSRDRRRERRGRKKNTQLYSVQAALGSVNPQFTTLFVQLFEQRHTLCRLLSSSHKSAFTTVLGQILSSPHGMTSAQQNQMNLFIQNFSAHNLQK